MEQFLKDHMDLIIEYGVNALGVLVFFFIGWIIAVWMGSLTRRALEKSRIELTLSRFLSKAVRWGIMLLVILGCLSRFGIEMTSVAALIAAMGLAIGLAFQGSLSNLAAGMMLLIFKPFKVGDYVEIGGQRGTVYEIDILATAIDTPDNRRIIVPNSAVFGTTIENVSHHTTRRFNVSVGVDYGADIDRTREVLTKAVESVQGVLIEPASQTVLGELGDSAVNWQVRVWCSSSEYLATREAVTRAVKMHLEEAGIGIPYPQLVVHKSQE